MILIVQHIFSGVEHGLHSDPARHSMKTVVRSTVDYFDRDISKIRKCFDPFSLASHSRHMGIIRFKLDYQ